jgi:hypothetical protein
MAADLNTVAQLLQATLDPRQHKQGKVVTESSITVCWYWRSPAEAALKLEETKPNYSLLLLQIVASNDLPINTRLSSALYFKNFIRFNYVVCAHETSVTVLRSIAHKITGRGAELQTAWSGGVNHQARTHKFNDIGTTEFTSTIGRSY